MKNILNTSIEVYVKSIHDRLLFQPMEGCDGTADGAVDKLTFHRYMRFEEGAPGIIWLRQLRM